MQGSNSPPRCAAPERATVTRNITCRRDVDPPCRPALTLPVASSACRFRCETRRAERQKGRGTAPKTHALPYAGRRSLFLPSSYLHSRPDGSTSYGSLKTCSTNTVVTCGISAPARGRRWPFATYCGSIAQCNINCILLLPYPTLSIHVLKLDTRYNFRNLPVFCTSAPHAVIRELVDATQILCFLDFATPAPPTFSPFYA